jgi:hypothetical protein
VVDRVSNDCACLYGGLDDYDSSGFQCSQTRRARKEHVCVECRETIAKGQTYEVFSQKFEGDISSVKTCAVCCEIRAALYCDGFYFGQMWEDIRNQLFPRFTLACVEKLSSVAAKKTLTERYRDFLGVA